MTDSDNNLRPTVMWLVFLATLPLWWLLIEALTTLPPAVGAMLAIPVAGVLAFIDAKAVARTQAPISVKFAWLWAILFLPMYFFTRSAALRKVRPEGTGTAWALTALWLISSLILAVTTAVAHDVVSISVLKSLATTALTLIGWTLCIGAVVAAAERLFARLR